MEAPPFGSRQPEWIFVVGSTAYRSLGALKAGIKHFLKDSTLTWPPSGKLIVRLTASTRSRNLRLHSISPDLPQSPDRPYPEHFFYNPLTPP
jgi:hypothetical protein